MGQKVNPIGFRLAVQNDWRSKWYANKQEYAKYLQDDVKIREYVKSRLQFAAVARIILERAWNSLRVTIHSARPGLVIGRKGAEIEKMTEDISKLSGGKAVKIDIIEIKNPELEAQLVAENIAMQLERRISFRRAMKKSAQTTMDFGALGIKLRCAGRLGGAEIARSERLHQGTIPLQTLRVPIDYGFAEANTTAGKIGVKCWIHKPANMPEKSGPPQQQRPRPDRRDGGGRDGGGRDNRESREARENREARDRETAAAKEAAPAPQA